MSHEPVLTLPDTPCVQRAAAYSHALSARYFGYPVYLVGGALRDPDPRDIDIVIPIPDLLFRAMYGDLETEMELVSDASKRAEESADAIVSRWAQLDHSKGPSAFWRRWARDVAKQSVAMTLACQRQVDFKTQPESYVTTMFRDSPRLRLDCDLRVRRHGG